MEVGICKRGWRRAWRYPAYLWSLRWVYAVKKNPEVGIRVNPRIPPNTPLQITHHTIHVLERRYKISHHTLNVTPRETIFKNCHIQEMSELTNCHPRISPWEVCSKHTCLVIDTKTDLHCVSKKQDTKLLPITSPNVNRFSKFFHWQTHW